MENPVHYSIDRLATQAEDAAVGCGNHEVAIGLMQNKEADVRAELTAMLAADSAFQSARTGKLQATAEQRNADAGARAFIVLVRDRLKSVLGSSWSQMWSEVGFVDNSLAVPATLAERQAILLRIKDYLTAHAAHQVPALNITPAAAQAAYDALSDARAQVQACRADVAAKKSARKDSVVELRKCLRGLVTELNQLIPRDDGLWRAFGFHPPAAVGLPGEIESLSVIPSAPGHLLAHWPAAPLASRYYIYRKIVGVDSDYVKVKTVTETEADLNTLTAGQVVRVRVSAVNDAGEGLKTEPVEAVVP